MSSVSSDPRGWSLLKHFILAVSKNRNCLLLGSSCGQKASWGTGGAGVPVPALQSRQLPAAKPLPAAETWGEGAEAFLDRAPDSMQCCQLGSVVKPSKAQAARGICLSSASSLGCQCQGNPGKVLALQQVWGEGQHCAAWRRCVPGHRVCSGSLLRRLVVCLLPGMSRRGVLCHSPYADG